jgi:hypothetical protein
MKSGNLNFLEPSGPLQACNISKCYRHDSISADWQAVCTNVHWHTKHYSCGYCNCGEQAYRLNLYDMGPKQCAEMLRQETSKHSADRFTNLRVKSIKESDAGILLLSKSVRPYWKRQIVMSGCCDVSCSTGEVRCFWVFDLNFLIHIHKTLTNIYRWLNVLPKGVEACEM